MSDYWTPDAESYFGRITKAQIAQAVRVAEGTTRPFDADGKKADIAAAATRRVAGTGAGTQMPCHLRTGVGCRASYGWHR